MKIQDIAILLESYAPPAFQEDYDNAGLITGNPGSDCTGILVCLDATEEVIEEAINRKCNMVVSHHPIVFRGLKKITGKNYVERAVIAAIKNDIALYAIHTNLDNVKNGVNMKIAEKLNLSQLQVLQSRDTVLRKLVTFSPVKYGDKVREALFNAGGGNIGKYSECSFTSEGSGTFLPGDNAKPFVGEKGKRHEENEQRIEVIFPFYVQDNIIKALIKAHPYEEVAYDIYSLNNNLSDVGSGMLGTLNEEVSETEVLTRLKTAFGLKIIRHTPLTGKKVKKIAVCGGAGIFLLNAAKAAGADVFITSDIKYHEFFDAENRLLLADIGHYESEQFTIDLLFDILTEKFRNFAVLKTGVNTNPVQYFL